MTDDKKQKPRRTEDVVRDRAKQALGLDIVEDLVTVVDDLIGSIFKW